MSLQTQRLQPCVIDKIVRDPEVKGERSRVGCPPPVLTMRGPKRLAKPLQDSTLQAAGTTTFLLTL